MKWNTGTGTGTDEKHNKNAVFNILFQLFQNMRIFFIKNKKSDFNIFSLKIRVILKTF